MNKNIVHETAGLWTDIKKTGIEYENRLRKNWAKRVPKDFKKVPNLKLNVPY